jgi:hypothetical protein
MKHPHRSSFFFFFWATNIDKGPLVMGAYNAKQTRNRSREEGNGNAFGGPFG